MYLRYDTKIHYIDPVSGRYGKILNLKKYLRYNTDTRYRYFYRVPVSIGCIRLIGAGINVTCVLIDEFPVKFNSSGLFTALQESAFAAVGVHRQQK